MLNLRSFEREILRVMLNSFSGCENNLQGNVLEGASWNADLPSD